MKARNENGYIRLYEAIPSKFRGLTGNYIGGFNLLDTSVHQSEGFYDVVQPQIDRGTQVLGEIYFDGVNNVFTYPVINLTTQQITDVVNTQAFMSEMQLNSESIRKLLVKLTRSLIDSPDITEEDINMLTAIYPYYVVGKSYIVGDKFNYRNTLFEVIQSHTSQLDWVPTETASLYKRYTPPNQIDEWVQPLGSEDAYDAGAQVTHNGNTWESLIGNNVWEPGVYGWTQID